MDIRIEADDADLLELRERLSEHIPGDGLDLQEVTSSFPGEGRDAFLAAVIIAVAPSLVEQLGDTVRQWLAGRSAKVYALPPDGPAELIDPMDIERKAGE
jgi:hypothetical protein